MEKVDFKKTLDCYRAKRGAFRVVEVPRLQYLMVDGRGDPNVAPEFADAVAALYPVSYKLKFASKEQCERDFVVMPLEALWWADDMEHFTTRRDKSRWSWTMMIMQPEWITQAMVDEALAAVADRHDLRSLSKVRLETLHEGTCVQTLHVGPFDAEAEILERMHNEFIPSHGMTMVQRHHEIYLSDFRRVAPEKQRTILRQPVATA